MKAHEIVNKEELIKALRCRGHNMIFHYCDKFDCHYCKESYHDNRHRCDVLTLGSDAADAIERLQAENELKDGTITAMATDIGKLKSQMPKWISVNERQPEESGGYIAYIHEPTMIQKSEWEKQYDLSYVTELYFDKGKALWSDGIDESYNAVLSAVDTDNEFHVTHWMPLPEKPNDEGRYLYDEQKKY